MRRYWIETKDIFQDSVNFQGDVFHHIFEVCRQGAGSKFEVLTEESKAYFVEVTYLGKKNATATILEERIIPALPYPHIHVALSISRFPVMDSVMEKLVEMGVKSVQPFFSEFSFMRSDDKISANKFERWQKIVRSATQQSGRGDLMEIKDPVTFKKLPEIINLSANSMGLFAYEGDSALDIKTYVTEKQKENSKIENIWVIVGSEGGFSTQEVEKMTLLGLRPVTLGPQILRVETACMALVSALKYDFGLMR